MGNEFEESEPLELLDQVQDFADDFEFICVFVVTKDGDKKLFASKQCDVFLSLAAVQTQAAALRALEELEDA